MSGAFDDQPPEVRSLDGGRRDSLPPPSAAAERVREFLGWYGDGVVMAHPMTAHLAPTPTLARALRAWTAQVANARADYEAEPIRSCKWWDKDVSCDELRDDDAYYCPRHRRMKNKANARRRDRRAA